uniref:Uncharacterized protein n=1 Tax=Oryza glumipatula TaxID=40148 RepID=A0A0E0BI85_9ORYZ
MAAAIRELESLTLDREIMQWKDILALKVRQVGLCWPLVRPTPAIHGCLHGEGYRDNKWFGYPQVVQGFTKIASRKSPYSLYGEDISYSMGSDGSIWWKTVLLA